MEVEALNWFDIYVITIVVVSCILAFVAGFIKSLFTFITWFGTIAITVFSYTLVHKILGSYIQNDKLVIALSSLGLFVVLLIVISFITSKFISAMDRHRHGIFDRSMGFAFGFLRGVIIVLLMFISVKLILVSLNLENDDAPAWSKEFKDSAVYQLLDGYSGRIAVLLPDEIYKKYANIKNKPDINFNNNIVLNDKINDLVKKMFLALPLESSKAFADQYEEKKVKLTEVGRADLYKKIFIEYKGCVKSNKISQDKLLSISDLNILDSTFGNNDNAKDTGYSAKNVKQLDRLIDTLK